MKENDKGIDGPYVIKKKMRKKRKKREKKEKKEKKGNKMNYFTISKIFFFFQMIYRNIFFSRDSCSRVPFY